MKSDPIPTRIVYSSSITSVNPCSPLFTPEHSVQVKQRIEKSSILYHRKDRKSCSNCKMSSHLTPGATNLVDEADSSDFVYGSRVRYLQNVLHGAESNV
jgi:hypothetical protein